MTQIPLFGSIADRSKDFTDAQQRIAEFVVRHPAEVAFMNARELAEAVGLSESSVVRFAYSAGFDGYRGLQAAAQQVVNSQLTMQHRYLQRAHCAGNVVEMSVRNDIRNLELLERSISSTEVDLAAERIAKARRCYIAGFRGAAGLALIVSSAVSQLCRNSVQLSFDAGETVDLLVGAGPEDALVAISFRRYARRTLRIAEYAHRRGVFVIAITDSIFSPMRGHANVLLAAEVESSSFTYSLVAPLCVVNCLVLALTKQLGEGAAASVRDWEETYSQFDLLEGLSPTGGA